MILLFVVATAVWLVVMEAELGDRDNRRVWIPMLRPLSARRRAEVRARPVDRRTTVVTGFFEIPNGGSLREHPDGTRYVLTSDRYWQWARRVLSFRAPMIVFTTPRMGDRVLAARDELGMRHLTRVVHVNVRAWLARREFAMMRELLAERGLDRASHKASSMVRMQPALRAVYRRIPPWLVGVSGIKWKADVDDPEATDAPLPSERVAAAAARAACSKLEPMPADASVAAHWSKVFWTLDAIRRDPFGSESFLWVDWGLLRGGRQDNAFMHREWPGPRTKARFASDPRMHYVQYSLAFNALCKPPASAPDKAPSFGISAGAFGGAKAPLRRALNLIVADLRSDLARGVVVEEETSMTRVAHERPDLFRCTNPVMPVVIPRPHYSCVTDFME